MAQSCLPTNISHRPGLITSTETAGTYYTEIQGAFNTLNRSLNAYLLMYHIDTHEK